MLKQSGRKGDVGDTLTGGRECPLFLSGQPTTFALKAPGVDGGLARAGGSKAAARMVAPRLSHRTREGSCTGTSAGFQARPPPCPAPCFMRGGGHVFRLLQTARRSGSRPSPSRSWGPGNSGKG